MSNSEAIDYQHSQRTPFDYLPNDGEILPLLHVAFESGQQLTDVIETVRHIDLPTDKSERLHAIAQVRQEGLVAQWYAEDAQRRGDPNATAVKELADMVSGAAAEYGVARRGIRGYHDTVERAFSRNLRNDPTATTDDWIIFANDNQAVHGEVNRRIFKLPEAVEIPASLPRAQNSVEKKSSGITKKQQLAIGVLATATLSGFLPAMSAQAASATTPSLVPEVKSTSRPTVEATNPNDVTDPANLVALKVSTPAAKETSSAKAQTTPASERATASRDTLSTETTAEAPSTAEQPVAADLGLVPAAINTEPVGSKKVLTTNAQPATNNTVASPEIVAPSAAPIDQIPSLSISNIDQTSQDSPSPTAQPSETLPTSSAITNETPASTLTDTEITPAGSRDNTIIADTIVQETNNTLSGLTPAQLPAEAAPSASNALQANSGTPEVAPSTPEGGDSLGLTPAPIEGTPAPEDATPGSGGIPEVAPPATPDLPPVETVPDPTPTVPEAPAPAAPKPKTPALKSPEKSAPVPDVIINPALAGETMWTSGQLEQIKANLSVYLDVQKQTGVPWEIMATLHERESSLALVNPNNGQGLYQLFSLVGSGRYSFAPGPISQADFEQQTLLAANFLLGKAADNSRVGGPLTMDNPDKVKDVLFAYNGISNEYIAQAHALGFSLGAEGSPYVMNLADNRRNSNINPEWKQVMEDGGAADTPANQIPGAYPLIQGLQKIEKQAYDDATNGGDKQPDTPRKPEVKKFTGFKFPVPPGAVVSSPYGQRGPEAFHDGEDFAVPNGTPFYASAAGEVKVTVTSDVRTQQWCINALAGIGQTVDVVKDPFQKQVEITSVINGDTYVFTYAHLSKVTVAPGQIVTAGQAIGKTGNSGCSTGPHAHFGVTKNGVSIDPASLQYTNGANVAGAIDEILPSTATSNEQVTPSSDKKSVINHQSTNPAPEVTPTDTTGKQPSANSETADGSSNEKQPTSDGLLKVTHDTAKSDATRGDVTTESNSSNTTSQGDRHDLAAKKLAAAKSAAAAKKSALDKKAALDQQSAGETADTQTSTNSSSDRSFAGATS